MITVKGMGTDLLIGLSPPGPFLTPYIWACFKPRPSAASWFYFASPYGPRRMSRALPVLLFLSFLFFFVRALRTPCSLFPALVGYGHPRQDARAIWFQADVQPGVLQSAFAARGPAAC